ncbi:MAG TPA: ankyrin repeat domain-containing protein [Pyrinomonadaceae bacterium]|nr:ankyrin repeat domain-containing protein [Pyrinomonadaceae bacterium]
MNSQSTTKLRGAPTLFGAAEEGDAAALARMLGSGASADERRQPGGETPLMRAAARGHLDVVRLLLDAGADPDARRADGFTPLILAVFFGHEGVVRLLVARGADAHARTSLGTTAARWAEARGFASMAEVLREAEASRPPAPVRHAPEKATVAQATAATKATSDEVEIFSRRIGRSDAGGEEDEVESSVPAPDAEEDDRSSSATAAGVSVRRGGQLPARPSASTFRVGDFLRSWQGSLGALLLLAAFGVAVFALVQKRTAPRAPVQPTPAPQAAAQQTPAPSLPTPEPSPAFPTPDPQAVITVNDQGYPAPGGVGQPYYVPQGPVAPVPTDVPRELTVVSESGAASAQDAGQAGRRAANANDSAPPRNNNASDPSAPRAARTPEPLQPRPAPTAAPTNQTPPPAPEATPRAKVIQWPPQ